jgi:pimeloyl-ACP methyl ester carboxylesterase
MKSFLLEEWQAFLRYEDLPGDDPPFVYLSGAMLPSHPTFASVVAESQALGKHRSIFIDLLGSGFSDAPEAFGYSLEDHATTVAAVLDDLQLKGCGVVGYSLGGAVAITLAAHRPDLVSRLALMEAPLDPRTPDDEGLGPQIARQTETQFCEQGFHAFMESLRQAGIKGNPSMATLGGLLQVSAPYALHRSAVSAVHGTRPTMRERLLAMSIPRAYIYGTRSTFDFKWESLAKEDIQMLSVPDVGHDMAFANPGGVAEALNTAMNA